MQIQGKILVTFLTFLFFDISILPLLLLFALVIVYLILHLFSCRDRESHCGFFCWSDEVSKLSMAALSSYPSSSVVRSNYPTTSSSSLLFTPNCLCNHPASVKTVQKEGPNKGRTFFCCSKPM